MIRCNPFFPDTNPLYFMTPTIPRLDISPFCESTIADPKANWIEFSWADPRDIQYLLVEFEASLPSLPIFNVSYWQATWPKNRPKAEITRGSGGSGWTKMDDLIQGCYRHAEITTVLENPTTLRISFQDLIIKEFPEEQYHCDFRRTLKIRISADQSIPIEKIAKVKIFTTTELQTGSCRILGDEERQNLKSLQYSLKIFNGYFSDGAIEQTSYKLGDSIDFLAAQCIHSENFDATLITLKSPSEDIRSFTFKIEDLEKFKMIFLPDLGFIVGNTKQHNSYNELSLNYKDQHEQLISKHGKNRSAELSSEISPSLDCHSVYDRIFDLPERRFEDAMRDFREKSLLYYVIGCEACRAKCAIMPRGDLAVSQQFITKAPHEDQKRLWWNKTFSRMQFEWELDKKYINRTQFDKPISRNIEAGYLPIIYTTWLDEKNQIEIKHTAYATVLEGTKVGTEPEGNASVIAMIKYQIKNLSSEPHQIKITLRLGETQTFTMKEEEPHWVYDSVKITQLNSETKEYQFQFFESEKNNWRPPYEGHVIADGIHAPDLSCYTLEIDLSVLQSKDVIFKLPLLCLPNKNHISSSISNTQALTNLDFQKELKLVIAYWKARIATFSKIHIPNQELQDFYSTQLIHDLITNDREIGSDLIIGRVGSMGYGCYANEVAMITMDLDRRGLFDVTRRMLETFIKYQGTVGLNGDYEDIEGIFFGAGGYESGVGYNQNQGFVLWAIAEHVRLSGDWEWLIKNTDGITKACRWIINERKNLSNKIEAQFAQHWKKSPYPKECHYLGLMPAGGVEDITDFWYWLSTNAYNSYGLTLASELLTELQHPDAKEISLEANDFKAAVKTIFTKAMELSPVIRLRNGFFQPMIPCHAQRRGRGFGWIQEVLEGPIHLIRCKIFPANSQEATWIIRDLEDNLYLSEEFGYRLVGPDFEKYWFTKGGFSMQPCLLCNPQIYAMRNEPKHYLRAVFNAIAVNYRSDTKSFTEHPLPTFYDFWGHFYKTSDEANASSYIRTMFIQEKYIEEIQESPDFEYHQVNTLQIGGFIPQQWYHDPIPIEAVHIASYFGFFDFYQSMIKSESKIDFKYKLTWDHLQRPIIPTYFECHFRCENQLHDYSGENIRWIIDEKEYKADILSTGETYLLLKVPKIIGKVPSLLLEGSIKKKR